VIRKLIDILIAGDGLLGNMLLVDYRDLIKKVCCLEGLLYDHETASNVTPDSIIYQIDVRAV